MGSLTNNANAIAAFTGQPFPNGLDLGRCTIQFDIGVLLADPVATFLQGQIVYKGANGVTLCDGATGHTPLGIAKWNKATTLYGVNVDEAVVLPGTTAVALKKSTVSGVKVNSAVSGSSSITTYTVTTDYTVNAVNGTVTRVGGGAIADGQTVYVTYTYAIQSTDLDFQGRNFWNFTDDVTIQDGRITVITGWSMLFTTQYNSSIQFSLGDSLVCSTAGLFTKAAAADAGTGAFPVGTVIQVPTATDPYLGLVKQY